MPYPHSQYMTREELYSNAAFLTLAGSETTSTVMAVVVYMIGTRTDVKANLLKELQATFNSEEDINMRSAATLSYLMAVIEESMRCHPPGPNSLWRITPPEGNRILGNWIPGNVSRAVPKQENITTQAKHMLIRPSWASPTESCTTATTTSNDRTSSSPNAGSRATRIQSSSMIAETASIRFRTVPVNVSP